MIGVDSTWNQGPTPTPEAKFIENLEQILVQHNKPLNCTPIRHCSKKNRFGVSMYSFELLTVSKIYIRSVGPHHLFIRSESKLPDAGGDIAFPEIGLDFSHFFFSPIPQIFPIFMEILS